MSIEQRVEKDESSNKESNKVKVVEQKETGIKEKNIPLNPELELKNKKLFEAISNAMSTKNCTELNSLRNDLNKGISTEEYGTGGKRIFQIENNALVLNNITEVDFGGGTKEILKTQVAKMVMKNGSVCFSGLAFGTYLSIDGQGKMIAGTEDGKDPIKENLVWWVNTIHYIGKAWNDVIYPQIYK